MENRITIFELSPAFRDGGSRERIATNKGIFSLKKKLGDKKDYFYFEGKLITDEGLVNDLSEAIKVFINNKFREEAERAVESFNFSYGSLGYKAVKL